MPNVLTQDLVSSAWDDWKRRADDMMAGLGQQAGTIAEEVRRNASGLVTQIPFAEPPAPPAPPPPPAQVAPEAWSSWQQLANQPTASAQPATTTSPQQDAWAQWQQVANQPLTSLIGQQEQQPTTQPEPTPSATGTANRVDPTGHTFPLIGFKVGSSGNNDPHATYHSDGGSDLMAPRGTPVVSMGGGTVSEVMTEDANRPGSTIGGNALVVRGDDGLDYYYAHLDGAPQVGRGQRISAGDLLGAVGNSGNAWKGGQGETHLHIGIGHGISTGQGAEGGLGQNFNAKDFLGNLLNFSGDAPANGPAVQPHGITPAVPTTAGLSGGGAQSGQVDDRGKLILDNAAQIASWLGLPGQQALQAILITEGGLNNARGDNGKSAGPLQFFEGGQLANFAKAVGMTLQDAKTYVEQHPLEAIQWAIGTPTNPGYLGAAIARGIANNYTGAELATYAQRTGQVSESPERAGRNFDALFGQGQQLITAGQDVFNRGLQMGQDLGTRLGQSGQSLLEQTQTLMNQRPLEGFTSPITQQLLDYASGETARRNQQQGYSPEFTARAQQIAGTSLQETNPLERVMGLLGTGGNIAPPLTVPEWQNLNQQRRAQIEAVNPYRDQPFVGGAINEAADILTDPTTYLVGGPLARLGEGVGARVAGRVPEAVARIAGSGANQATQGAIYSALRAASEPGATPQSIAEAAVAGGGAGGVLGAAGAGVGRLLANVPRVPGMPELPPITIDADGQLLPARIPDVAAPGAETTRMFHGTGAGFETPSPGRFVEETGHGPGYFLTDNPDVAAAYARLREPPSAESIGRQQDAVANLTRVLREADLAPEQRTRVERLVADAQARVAEGAGPNIRAVDVPSTARLFDIDSPLPLALNEARRIADAAGEHADAFVGRSPQEVYDALERELGSKGGVNSVLAQAGFDGVRYAGERMHPSAGPHEVFGIFPESLDQLRNAVSMRQGGQASPQFAATLGASGLGGAAGYLTAPEGATEEEKRIRAGVGALAAGGLTHGALSLAGRAPLPYEADVRQWLQAQTPLQSTATRQSLTPAQGVANWISSNLLVSPASLAWNSISQSGHLLWQPLMRTLEGHPGEAADAFRAMLMSSPEALRRAGDVLTKGTPYAGVGGQQGTIVSKWFPGLRGNLAGDALFRSLNETMGGVLEAQRVVREAGAQTPQQMQQVVGQNAARIGEVAQREGLASAFLSPGQRSSPLVEGLSRWKETLLTNSDPNVAKQAAAQILGVLVHQAVPFARMPEAILGKVLRRFPIIGNALDVFQVIKPPPGANQAQLRASAMANGAITASLIGAYLAGNIRGADDPERPGQIQVAGQWLPMQSLGIVGGQAAMVASIMDAWQKAQNLPADSGVETVLNGIGQAANSAGKLAAQDWPMADTFKLLNLITEGNLSQAGTQLASNLIGGLTPLSGALGAAENLVNPVSRQVERSGLRGLVEPTMARIPGVSGLLPEQVNTATGAPQIRPSSGVGSLLRLQNEPIPAVESELAKLNRAGYSDIKPPSKTLPKERTVYGVKVPISTAQAQQIQIARGRIIAAYGAVIDNPGYQRMTPDQKARYWQQVLDMANRAGDVAGEAVVAQTPDLGRILATRQRVAGRLVTSADRQRDLDLQQAAIGGRA